MAQSVPPAAIALSSSSFNSTQISNSQIYNSSLSSAAGLTADGFGTLNRRPSRINSHQAAEILSVVFKGGSLAGMLCLALLLGERALRHEAQQPINSQDLPFVSFASEVADGDEATAEDAEQSRFNGPISGPIFSGVTKIFSYASAPIAEVAPFLALDPKQERAAEEKVLADSRNRTAMSFIAGLIAAPRPSASFTLPGPMPGARSVSRPALRWSPRPCPRWPRTR